MLLEHINTLPKIKQVGSHQRQVASLRNIITEWNVNFSCDLWWDEENITVWKLSIRKRSPIFDIVIIRFSKVNQVFRHFGTWPILIFSLHSKIWYGCKKTNPALFCLEILLDLALWFPDYMLGPWEKAVPCPSPRSISPAHINSAAPFQPHGCGTMRSGSTAVSMLRGTTSVKHVDNTLHKL